MSTSDQMLWLCLAVVGWLCMAAALPTESIPLTPGTLVERTLGNDGSHGFHADLAAGEPWLLQVEQLGIDVVVEVEDPAGRSLLIVDTPLGREGTESLLLTPSLTGLYGIEVRSEIRGVPEGRYTIRLDQLPTMTMQDRLRLRAEEAVTDAGRLYAGREDGAKEQAVAKLREALDLWRDLEQPRQEARAWMFLGGLFDDLTDFPRAAAAYERALALWRRLDEPRGTAAALARLGLTRQNLGELPQALDRLEEALALLRTLGDPAREAETRNSLCLTLQRAGRFHDAEACYEKTLAQARALGDAELEATLLNNLGGIASNLGRPDRHRDYLRQALELRRSLGDELGEAFVTSNLGAFHRRAGEMEQALRLYRRALAIFERLEHRRGQAFTLNNLGFAHLTLGEIETAQAYLLRALPLRRTVGDRNGEAVTLVNLGRAFTDSRDLGKALACYRRALEIGLETGNRRGVANARKLLGELHLERRDPGAARAPLERALESVREMGNRRQEAEVLELLSRVHLGLGDPVAARERAVRALEIQRAVEHPLGEIAARITLARIERRLGRTEAGREELEAGLEDLEDLHGRLDDPSQKASFLATQRQAYELYVDLRMEQGDPRAALEASERARARSLLAVLTEREDGHAEIPRSRILDASAIQALLDDETALLEIFLGEERSFLWWVTSTSVTAHELPPRREVEELAERVHRQTSAIHRRTPQDREALTALGELLLGPVADRLRDRRLVFVPDGALHFVPLAALGLPSTGEPVLTRHEVAHLPSASVLALQRRETFPRSGGRDDEERLWTVAILADPVFGETPQGPELAELDRLPHTRAEAEAITALVPEDRRLLALGDDARRSRVLEDELTPYRIVHFATHGLIHPRAPERSGLALTEGFLSFDDVASLELSADLVVLSGCRTALGRQIRGEGLVGLTRGFLYAGVPRVVASFWQVRDRATAELMAGFYRALLVEDQSPTAALRTAQLALRQERRFRDPYYWAAFALQGDWR